MCPPSEPAAMTTLSSDTAQPLVLRFAAEAERTTLRLPLPDGARLASVRLPPRCGQARVETVPSSDGRPRPVFVLADLPAADEDEEITFDLPSSAPDSP